MMAMGKRVPLVKITVDGVEVDAKACTKCGEVKPLTEFHLDGKSCSSGRVAKCKTCVRVLTRLRTEEKARHKGRTARTQVHTKRTPASYAEEVFRVTSGEYGVTEVYAGTLVPIKHIHHTCGYQWPIRPACFVHGGKRCPKCAGNAKKSHVEYVNELSTLTEGRYEVLGFYRGARRKIEHRHKECGYRWMATPDHILNQQTGCPRCALSKGEKRVKETLERLEVTFYTHHRLEGCRNKRPLPFDFALETKKSLILIEYDGIQHSIPQDFAGKGEEWALEQFRKTQRNDRIKTDYCRANGIPLIRIKHTEFDEIESILTRELTNLGVISSETGNRLNDAI